MDVSTEINNVDGCPDPPPKEEAVPDNVKTSTPGEDAVPPELPPSDKSAVSDKDKELTWEKIAAEFTEDEEEAVDVPSAAPEPAKVPEPEPAPVADMVIEKMQDTESVSAPPEPQSVDDVSIEPVKEVDSLEEAQPISALADSGGDKSTEADVIVPDEVVEDPSASEPSEETEKLSVEESPVEKESTTEKADEENRVEEAVEIKELKSDEAPETEPADDVEYTVVEADEVETNEIIEEHIASESNTETVVIINPDQSQTEITIEQIEDEEEDDDEEGDKTEKIYIINKEGEGVDDPGEPLDEVKEVKPKKQRGRKPITDIPLHVLGRDITKPTEGVSNGGRTMPKPRLGVKVPYRNLTSQIVSKEEIEKEIMERFKLKQEQNSTSSGDILFARKLTQRLAKKLIPSERDKTSNLKPASEATTSVTNQVSEAEIKNNSDLIAILEGEGEEIPVKQQQQQQKGSSPEKEPISKNTEKWIALQQLKELPVSKNKIFKSKSEEEKTSQSPEASPAKASAIETRSQKEMEPRLKTGMVIKTYTRKRKSSELETILPPKKSIVVATTTIKSEDGPPTSVYVTKSSRVIKRKVIWDPDEVPMAKSPVKSPRPDTSSPPKSPVKVIKTETPPAKPTPEKKIPVPVKKVVSKSPPPKKPKRLTEVDRLLMDEGAVNMLYDVKNEDSEKAKVKNSNKSVISLDKAHKELMSKTKVIRNELQQNTNKDVQKQLRKKEVVSSPTSSTSSLTASPPKKDAPPVPISRKKSKDSARSSVHSPPASPAYNTAEASRIIRRHSSSSFSSTDGGGGGGGDDEEKMTRRKAQALAAAAAASTDSPKKKVKKNSDTKPPKETAKNNNNTVPESKTEKEFGQYKAFATVKKNKLVAIKLNKEHSYFTEQVLKELGSCLKELAKDDDCHVVSFTSNNSECFCLGLDYSCLVAEEEQVRKKKATELAALVKDFLRCLLNFPKVLVAGIQGECVGLGVTMLPLFDMVVASDTSTFSTPYAKLGCIPEAGFLLTVPHLNSHGLASELLYTGQVVKADDAFRRGLVTRLCWPEKYSEELKSMLALVATQSKQSIMATKQQLRHHLVQSTESALNSASKALIEHWTSSECQKNFLK